MSTHIRLEDVPARLFLASQDHQHELIRELTLIHLGNCYVEDAELPRRLARLIDEILTHYADVRTVTRQQALDGLARGEEAVTLEVPVRPGMVAALRRWLHLLEEADGFCSNGALLTLAAGHEICALRQWYVDAIDGCLTDPVAAEGTPTARYRVPDTTS